MVRIRTVAARRATKSSFLSAGVVQIEWNVARRAATVEQNKQNIETQK